jgi:DNA invertase Pin-like site-specific DNA recombinase
MISSENKHGPDRVEHEREHSVFVNTLEVAVEIVRPLDGGDAAERARDVMMLRLSDRGMSLRKIGKVFNVHYVTVRNRLNAIPAEAKTYYRTIDLDKLAAS